MGRKDFLPGRWLAWLPERDGSRRCREDQNHATAYTPKWNGLVERILACTVFGGGGSAVVTLRFNNAEAARF
jgi:hypothetical protein